MALLAGGLIAPLVSRSRAALAVAAAVGVSILIWASAPFTAFPAIPFFDGLQAGSVRYLGPAIAAGALELALAASTAAGLARMLALGLLMVALFVSLGRDISFGFPLVPPALTLFAGATAGAAVAWLATAERVPPRGGAAGRSWLALPARWGSVRY